VGTVMSVPLIEMPVEEVEEFVLNLTDLAVVKIQNILQERGVPNYGLRVFVAGGGGSGLQYGMAIESQERKKDEVIQVSGIKLYVDPASAEYLHGATIDYEDNLTSSGFRIDAPNAASTCGCGGGNSSGGCGCH
jgi:iron-sulfur cluster assembly accessory protein